MYKKDYIQRHLEEFGKVLAAILGSKRQNDWDKFEKEIAAATQRFTAMEINAVEQLSEAGFEKDILESANLTQEQRKILATLLFEKLSFYMERNDEENYLVLKNRCIKIYQHLQDNFTENEFDLDVHYKLGFLKNI